MRIAIVKRAPGIALSMDVYANQLVRALKSLYADAEIIEISPEPWWGNQKQKWSSGLGFKKYYERYFNHPRNTAKLDADIFHVLDHTDAHIVKRLHKQGKKVVVTCHDLVQFVYPEILNDQARWPIISLNVWKYSVKGMTHANHVITVSNNTKRDVASYLSIPIERISTIHNAVESYFKIVDTEKTAKFRLSNDCQPHEICLLNVGSTHSRKNVLMVLRTLKELYDENVPVKLWRTGGNFTEAQEKYIQEQQIGELITDFGRVSEEELIQIYNAADILFAPSLYEGFGLTVLEAMACGCPVITSNCSSLPEVAGDSAILVDPNNLKEAKDAIMLLTRQPTLYEQFVQKGLAHAKKFSWKTTAAQVYQIYLSAIDSKECAMGID